MIENQNIEIVTADGLLNAVRTMHDKGYRLVQIGATRLPEHVELTYSFDLNNRLANLRLEIPAQAPRLQSICSIYPCVLLYENEIHDLFGVEVEGMTVDFKGNLYKTAIKFPFGSIKPPVARPTTVTAPAATAASTPAALTGSAPAK